LAVSAKWYGLGLKAQYDSTSANRVDWVNDTIKVALTTSSYTPNQDTHDFFDDVTNEVTGTGYSAGGATLGTKTLTYDTATNEVRLDAADAVWTTSTITARYAVVYKSTGTASTSLLLGYVDFGGDQSTSSADFTISWDSTGVLKITAS
jgi:hypothetical protein